MDEITERPQREYLSQIETPTDSYVARYPWAIEMAKEQQHVFWPAEELGVEDDIQDFRVGLNDAERHGVLTAQSVLTQYELMIGGEEMWGGKIAQLFPRPDIRRMAACFANVEQNSHAPFYDIGNQVMGNATDEFYTRWKRDPILADRIHFIERCAGSFNPLEVTAALAFLEGAVLFSAFGYFKRFNSGGFNLLPHFVAGIDGSAKDEDFHSRASAMLFLTCRSERMDAGNHSPYQDEVLFNVIENLSSEVHAHELRITELMFAVPGNRTSTKTDVIQFFEHRIDVVRQRLGMAPKFSHDGGPIAKEFYKDLNTYKHSDFFHTGQLQYTRNWAKHKLRFIPKTQKEEAHVV